MLILCHGVFDVLHIGHLYYLQAAKALGDRLIVTITADRFINKGQGRPLFNHNQRREMLQALHCVDFCEILDEPTGISGILKFNPDIYAKGKDYADSSDSILKKERQAIELIGGKLIIVDPGIQYSSTEIMTGRLLAKKNGD